MWFLLSKIPITHSIIFGSSFLSHTWASVEQIVAFISVLTSAVHERLPPPVQTWFASQTSTLQSTSWIWGRLNRDIKQSNMWPTSRIKKKNHSVHSPQDGQTFCSDVLAAMLNPSYQVRNELMDGAFVLDWARDALSHLHSVAFTVNKDVGHLTLFQSLIKAHYHNIHILDITWLLV